MQPGFILRWGAVPGAASYDVEVIRMTYPYDAAHSTTIAQQNVAASGLGDMSAGPFDHPAQSMESASSPAELVLYRWIVRAVNDCGEKGDWQTSHGYPSLYDPDVSAMSIQMCQ